MLIRKGQWMGISALVVAFIVGFNPVMAGATGVGEVTVYGSGLGVTDIGDLELDIDEDEIWAQVDRDELRSFVDVEPLKESIDRRAILEKIDLDALRAQIDDEKIALEVDNDVHPIDVINVQLPVIGARSPFDFLIDPQNLVFATDAAMYGGGKVEEGANILFRNSEGEYNFSSRSDKLTITNRSNIPVRLSVQAKITTPGGVSFVDSRSALYGQNTSIYMALADEEGIIAVITEYGEASIDVVLEATPDGTYDFVWNEASGEYEYRVANEDAEFDSFSFFIVADCNKEANWGDVSAAPMISVSWKTEPVIPEPEELTEDEQEIIDELDSLVKGYLGIREVLNFEEDTEEVVEETAEENTEPTSSSDTNETEPNENKSSQEATTTDESTQEVTIEEEPVPEESSVEAALEASVDGEEESVAIKKEVVQTEVNQEEIRAGKIKNLVYQELLKLATEEYNRLYEEELNKLIDEVVEVMAKELFEELKVMAIKEKLGEDISFDELEELEKEQETEVTEIIEEIETDETLDEEKEKSEEITEITDQAEETQEKEERKESKETEEGSASWDDETTSTSDDNSKSEDEEKIVIF